MTGRPTDVVSPQLTIDGEKVNTSKRIEVIDPGTAKVFVDVPDAGADLLDTAVTAAQRAGRSWRALSLDARQKYLLDVVAAIQENLDELATLITMEQGKPLGNARGEIGAGIRSAEWHAKLKIPTEVIRDDDAETVTINRVPLPVTAAITAWNYPVLLAMFKMVPGLVAGTTMIIKPSPYTPVATLRLGEILQEVLPPGVVQVLSGGDELGRAMTSHPGINKISFTGSVPTGKAIMASAAPTLKRLTLELGGNDAGIVLDDADPKEIASGLYWGGLSNCGQVCAALKRLYVPESLADAIADEMAKVAASVVVGDGFDEGVIMGPLQNKGQLDIVSGLLEDAEKKGADVFFRGDAPSGPGYFHPVTLVRGLTEEMPLFAQEQFGPVMPMTTYTDLDEVVERANASDLGLGASVWSPDEERAISVASRLQAGSVFVNQHPNVSPDTPFGGLKHSGFGVEGSLHGVLAYTDISVLRVKH